MPFLLFPHVFLCSFLFYAYICTRSISFNSMGIIELHDLSIGYKVRKSWKIVASHLNAILEQGTMTCLIGPNGVGKSTLLRTLSAFQPKVEGKMMLNGKDLDDYTEKQLAKLIGVVLTEKPDVQNMTVREVVGLGRSPYTGFWGTLNDEDWQVVDEAVQLVGITALSGRMIQTLSDGERQKVMIAKALAQQTPVIYLDEPTAFLDYPSKVEMMRLLQRLSHDQQKTVFLSTHDLELALQIADIVWLMDASGQLFVGTPHQLAQQGHLGRFVAQKGIVFDAERLSVIVE